MVVTVEAVEARGGKFYEATVRRENGSRRRYKLDDVGIAVWESGGWVRVSNQTINLTGVKTERGIKGRVQKFFAGM